MPADEHAISELPLLVADIFEAAGALRARGDRLAGQVGQTQARWQVLSVLSDGDWTVASAARRLGVTRQSVQRIVNELDADGLTFYAPNPRHARSPLVRLSEAGRTALDQITRAAGGWHRQAGEGLSLADVLTTRTVLRRLINAADRTAGARRPARKAAGRRATAPLDQRGSEEADGPAPSAPPS